MIGKISDVERMSNESEILLYCAEDGTIGPKIILPFPKDQNIFRATFPQC